MQGTGLTDLLTMDMAWLELVTEVMNYVGHAHGHCKV